jgi:hypothetical protein
MRALHLELKGVLSVAGSAGGEQQLACVELVDSLLIMLCDWQPRAHPLMLVEVASPALPH